MSTCLYTGIFGDYNIPLLTPPKIKDLHFVCFTDKKNFKSPIGWETIYIERDPVTSPLMFCKKIKCLSHEYLPEWNYTIWLDANFCPKNTNYLTFIQSECKTDKLLLYRHNCLARMFRDCIYTEGKYSLTIPKYREENILQQLGDYEYVHNFPYNYGLFQAGFLYRNNKDVNVQKFNNCWLSEIEKYGKYTPQCQLSLSFALWKSQIKYDILTKESMWNIDTYNIIHHNPFDQFVSINGNLTIKNYY